MNINWEAKIEINGECCLGVTISKSYICKTKTFPMNYTIKIDGKETKAQSIIKFFKRVS